MAASRPGAPRGIPDCLKKRRLLHDQEISPDLCRQLGEKFLALEWWEDALEFFQKGQVSEGLARLRELAIHSGDAHLMGRLGETDPAVWRQVADVALAQGKLHFAHRALKAAGDDEAAAAVAARLCGPPAAQE
ncbi:MAG: hypothetical protein WHT07_02640 [Desulfobaccales bacterium]